MTQVIKNFFEATAEHSRVGRIWWSALIKQYGSLGIGLDAPISTHNEETQAAWNNLSVVSNASDMAWKLAFGR